MGIDAIKEVEKIMEKKIPLEDPKVVRSRHEEQFGSFLGSIYEDEFFSSAPVITSPSFLDSLEVDKTKKGEAVTFESLKHDKMEKKKRTKAPVTVAVSSKEALVLVLPCTLFRNVLDDCQIVQHENYLHLLEKLPLFKHLPRTDLIPLVKFLRPRRVESDKIIAIEGLPVTSILLFQVMSSTVFL
jgi:hypothetical protein